MIEFTVELKEKTLKVMADIAKEEEGALLFYSEEKDFSCSGGLGIPSANNVNIKERLVGRFDEFECFYIKANFLVGDPNE